MSRKRGAANRTARCHLLSATCCLLSAVCLLFSPASSCPAYGRADSGSPATRFHSSSTPAFSPRSDYSHLADYMAMRPVVTQEFGFTRVTSLAGLTAEFTRHFSARFYGDLGSITGKPVLDLDARANAKGLGVQLGQFRPPLEFRNPDPALEDGLYRLQPGCPGPARRPATFATSECSLTAVEGISLPPWPPSTAMAGSFRTTTGFKDIIGRVVVTPFGSESPYLGGHVYLGSDTSARRFAGTVSFRRYSGEIGWNARELFLRAELVGGTGINGFNAALGYRTGNLQPVVRFERMVEETPNLPISILTFGLNGFFARDMVKPMLDFSWTSDKVCGSRKRSNSTFQLQAASLVARVANGLRLSPVGYDSRAPVTSQPSGNLSSVMTSRS